MELSEIYEAAVEQLDKRGWIQNGMVADDGVCAWGAVNAGICEHLGHAFDVNHEHEDERKAYLDAMCRLGRPLPGWNDNDAKNITEVKDKLMEFAKQCRNEGR